MSSPSPDPQKGDLTYQSSETSDHGLLSHVHTCTCSEKSTIESTKTELAPHTHCMPKSAHHHVISLSHPPNTTSHLHPHVHVHTTPKIETTPKMSCTCHNKQEDCETIGEIEPRGPSRKMEPDDRIEVSPLPPALPPRPPPRPRYEGSLSSRQRPRMIGKFFDSHVQTTNHKKKQACKLPQVTPNLYCFIVSFTNKNRTRVTDISILYQAPK